MEPVQWTGQGLLAEHLVGAQYTLAGKSVVAPLSGQCSLAPLWAEFRAKVAAAWVGVDCRPVPSPWASG